MQVTFGAVSVAAIQVADDPTRNLSKEERKKISFEVWVESPTAKYLKKVPRHLANECWILENLRR
jgi:hypothetical protein